MFIVKWLANAIEKEKSNDVFTLDPILTFHDLQALLKLQTRKYHHETCFGHVESILKRKTSDGHEYGISIYVEPSGNVLRWDKSVISGIKWWETVFLSQPRLMGYVEAGWKIYEIKDTLPENPIDVWDN
jgi:hypothetical protein